MKKFILLFSLCCAFLPAAFADDQTRAVQQYLKDQGFYYGQVDGAPGSETTAAIKRYQIRNGLEVTGQLNPQTLAAMNLAAPASIPASPEQEIRPQIPSPGTPGDALSKNQPPSTSVPPPTSAPVPAQVPQPAMANDYSVLFRGTPYERAPGEVQFDTLRHAQIKLFRAGFYRGEIDGRPGATTTQALMRYQADASLPRTGRLDMDTLADLDLLPHARTVQPLYYYYPDPGPGRPVYRGIWVH